MMHGNGWYGNSDGGFMNGYMSSGWSYLIIIGVIIIIGALILLAIRKYNNNSNNGNQVCLAIANYIKRQSKIQLPVL
jgi:ABC-type uncharacterized transport system permease subunit